jgi:DNA-binding NarL/FixJ family response regulator
VKGHRQILVIQAPTNLSGPEIASKVSVSVNTVNTDVRNINAKLQAPRSGEGHTLICQAGRMEGFGPGAPGWGIGKAQS